MPFFIAAGIAAGGALLGGVIQGQAAKGAAQTQANASENATQAQLQMFNQVQGNEQPYIQAGKGAQSQLNYLMGIGGPQGQSSSAGGYGSMNQPFNAQTFKSLSPAYQFQLQQGQQGVLNADASGAGSQSGAAMKDLIGYNQGMANTSFNSAFNMYQQQQNNVFGRLNQIATLGSNAGSNQATGASTFGGNIGSQMTATGSYLGAGQIGQANAYAGAIGSASYLPWLMQGQQNPAANVGNDAFNSNVVNPQQGLVQAPTQGPVP